MHTLRDYTGLFLFLLAILLISGCSLLFKEPESCFEASVYRSVPEKSISFSNCSTNGESYLWDFGDGTTSTDANPTHSYTSYGNYTVSLITTLKEEKMDSLERTVVVGDLLLEQVAFSRFFTGTQEPVTFSILDSRGSLVQAPYFIIDKDGFQVNFDPAIALPDSQYTFVFDGQSTGKVETQIRLYEEVGADMRLQHALTQGDETQGMSFIFANQ